MVSTIHILRKHSEGGRLEMQKEAKISETLEKIKKHDRGRKAIKRSAMTFL